MALTQEDLQAIGEVVEKKIQSAKEEILIQMAKDREDMAGFFHKTWKKMDEANERIGALEEHVGLAHKN